MSNEKSTLYQADIPFAQVPNDLLEDQELSWKAKGLYSYLLSRPDDWQFYQSHLKEQSTDGKCATRSAIEELEEAGWLARERERNDDATWGPYTYYIRTEKGVPASGEGGDDPDRNTQLGSSGSDYPRRMSGDYNNTDVNNTDSQTKNHHNNARGGSGSSDDDLNGDDPLLKDSHRPQAYRVWSDEYDRDKVPDADRMDMMRFRQTYSRKTSHRIGQGDPKRNAAVRGLLTYFPKDKIVEWIDAAAQPGIDNPWSYLFGCAKRHAKESTPGMSDSDRPAYEKRMDLLNGGDQ